MDLILFQYLFSRDGDDEQVSDDVRYDRLWLRIRRPRSGDRQPRFDNLRAQAESGNEHQEGESSWSLEQSTGCEREIKDEEIECLKTESFSLALRRLYEEYTCVLAPYLCFIN